MEKRKRYDAVIYFMEATDEQGTKTIEDYGYYREENGIICVYDADRVLRFIVNKDVFVCIETMECDD